MNEDKNSFERNIAASLKVQIQEPALENNIMAGIAALQEKKKAERKKVMRVIQFYIGFTLITFTCMVIGIADKVLVLSYDIPELSIPAFQTINLQYYYILLVIVCTCAVLSFGTYFIKSRHVR